MAVIGGFRSVLLITHARLTEILEMFWRGVLFLKVAYQRKVVTLMDTPKYGETLKCTHINYQPILVVLPKVYPVIMVYPEQFMKANHFEPALRLHH